MQYVIQTLMGAVGAVGFAALFNVKGKRLILFFLGGALDWAVYLTCTHHGCSMFMGLFFATMTAALSSEVLARVIHAPVLISLVPMLIPLVPGSDLYYCMDGLIRGHQDVFLARGGMAVSAAGAICLGIICVTAISHIFSAVYQHFCNHNKNHPGSI